ncbi:MAG: glycosyltransferase [Chitinivibrionales bacterium]|nr:glycosyltransferase [Chitinivibrionales bacterium]
MSINPYISVVMPVYNAAATLEAALASVLSQDEHAIDLIAVDDGSSDGSAELLERAAAADRRVRMLHQPHGGIVAALNAGLELSRGRYIARMDADDRSLPGRLSGQRRLLDTDMSTGLVSCLVAFDQEEHNQGYRRYAEWTNSMITHEQIHRNRFIESPLAHPTVMFRRELIERHGGYADGDFPEDYELWLRWLDAGVRMQKVPSVLYHWRDPAGRLSRTDPRYRDEAFYRCKAHYLARLLHATVNRPIWVWGAGRPTRKRAEMLASHGVTIAGYIDIDPRKIGQTLHGRPVRAPEQLPPPGEAFVLSYVGSRGARERIRAMLVGRGYEEERDFLCCA